ncbi:NuA4-domain-containing protein [Trichodelitschia bisporula]|uniref:Chromatin modification-related protein EAF6 n=1 Tax=Trichodelitschia bisporula TaxID=703511 RepID=A0A6G1I6I3_9PEZI|nr:NuA4-domain-containing protein [Trichodelitschia bisporula]
MSENAHPQPNADSARPLPNPDSTRGFPYYEKLRRDLRETLKKKRELDQQIARQDENIYKLETQYLEEATAGNIVKGFENYIKGGAGGGGGGAGAGASARRKGQINEADRIFSRTSMKNLRDSPTPSSGPQSHAATPASSFPLSARESNHPTPSSNGTRTAQGKKKKASDDDEDTKSVKRGKITYGRE